MPGERRYFLQSNRCGATALVRQTERQAPRSDSVAEQYQKSDVRFRKRAEASILVRRLWNDGSMHQIQRREGKGPCLTDAHLTFSRRPVRVLGRYAMIRTCSIAVSGFLCGGGVIQNLLCSRFVAGGDRLQCSSACLGLSSRIAARWLQPPREVPIGEGATPYALRDFLSRAGSRRQAALMLRVRLWAWPPHVMKLGPIGIAGNAEQSVPSRHDHAEATEKRHRWRLRDQHGAPLNAACRAGRRRARQKSLHRDHR